jgi:hypothetical protein
MSRSYMLTRDARRERQGVDYHFITRPTFAAWWPRTPSSSGPTSSATLRHGGRRRRGDAGAAARRAVIMQAWQVPARTDHGGSRDAAVVWCSNGLRGRSTEPEVSQSGGSKRRG